MMVHRLAITYQVIPSGNYISIDKDLLNKQKVLPIYDPTTFPKSRGICFKYI